jgi:hypothetical protein
MTTKGNTPAVGVAVKVRLSQHLVDGQGYGHYLFVSSSSPLGIKRGVWARNQFVGRYYDGANSCTRHVFTICRPAEFRTLDAISQQIPRVNGEHVTWLSAARLYTRIRSVKLYLPKKAGLKLPSAMGDRVGWVRIIRPKGSGHEFMVLDVSL